MESAASKQTHCFKVCPCTLYTPLVFADIMKNAGGNDEKDGFGEKSIMSFQSTAICRTVTAPGYHFSNLK